MFYEFRRYQVQQGQRDAWVKVMSEIIIPFQIGCGMDFVAEFIDDERPDDYIWMRRFESEAQREQLYAVVYGGQEWQDILAEHGHLLAAKPQVTRLIPTTISPLR
ncbi:NIPSNAP family protein (plasmid) [Deinococcus sp. KNUC1210]|uniref:NIPSNAP family protein n=1 Tax=Deinococcus sp. KNUC1210 TaxID=2917691 RepID=UPI001EEFD927|nr:NIPSNAP family protein [Deinococcus sp. KNUC1210]ULH18312.1 NIPSNAP family protein [Deinococcus sp. KNUC1210]